MTAENEQLSTPIALRFFANAGELFGCLHNSLGFGELTMLMSSEQQAMCYNWMFKAKGCLYCCKQFVSFCELESSKDLKALASHIAETWKSEHRKTSQPT